MKSSRIVCLIIMTFLAAMPIFSGGGGEDSRESGEVVLNFPTFWVGQDSKTKTVALLVERFNNEHAGSVKVVLEPNPSVDGYREKLNTQLSSGKAPDIFIFNPDPTTFQYYDSDILMDFTDKMNDDWRSHFVQSYLEDSTRKGRLKTIPFEIGITPLWYNEALFKKAGVEEFPQTIEEFWMAADKLKASGIVPGSQMTGGVNAWTSMLWYSHIMGSLGGPDVWEKPLSDPLYVQAARVLRQLYADGNTTRDAVGGDAGVSGGHYMAKNTAVFINGPWYVGRIRSDAPEVHGATKLVPAPQVGSYYGHQVGFMLSNLAAGNTEDPGKKAGVTAFFRYMTEPENIKMISEDSGSLFSVKFELGNSADPLQREFVRAASEASFVIGHFQSQVDVSVSQQFGPSLDAMVLGEATPEEFVQMLIEAQ